MIRLALTEKRRIACDGYIFPVEYYNIPGVCTFQDMDAVKQYARLKLEKYKGSEIEVYVNGGMAIELLALLQTAASLNIRIGILHYDRKNEVYIRQDIRWMPRAVTKPKGKIHVYALCAGRHAEMEGEAVFEQIPVERIFDFEWQEEQAKNIFAACSDECVMIYLSGLTSSYISALNAAYECGKQIIWLHYDYDTESYFQQIMDEVL